MRIFFVTNNYTPYSGGVVQSITAISNGLRKQGHEVFIITLNFLGGKHDDHPYIIRVPCPVKFRYKKNHMAIPWRPQNRIEGLIKQHKPDIIHVHHPFLLGVSALRAARDYTIPCVFTYHTLYEEYTHYLPIPRVCIQPLIRAKARMFCDKVTAIIVPSTYVKNYLESQEISTPTSIIPSPLRECFTDSIRIDPIKKKSEFFELLLVTRFVPEKNIPFVFEIMQLLPDNFRLTLVGYGSDAEKLKKLAFDTLQFYPERIRFIHKPDEESLLKLYRTADLFIFPAKKDTQGIVLAESMSQSLPVIAIDGPGQRDIIINGVNGFIVENAHQAATQIMVISDNHILHNHLKQGAYSTALRYTQPTIITQLVDIYNQITKKNTP